MLDCKIRLAHVEVFEKFWMDGLHDSVTSTKNLELRQPDQKAVDRVKSPKTLRNKTLLGRLNGNTFTKVDSHLKFEELASI